MRILYTVAIMLLLVMPLLAQTMPDADPKGIPANFGQGDYVNERDGSVFMTVPAGEFFMGPRPGDRYTEEFREEPGRMVRLGSYQISKYEVTNAQYARFIKASGYSTSTSEWQRYAAQLGPKAPAVYVSWDDATAYCKWAGLRLPNEAEWERAARGTDGRLFPWGDRWDASRAVSRYTPIRPGDPITPAYYAAGNLMAPKAVGSKPAGISPAGCLDMAGNAWEWVDGWHDPQKKEKVARGGGWMTNNLGYLRCSWRRGFLPDDTFDNLGFRCARTPRVP